MQGTDRKDALHFHGPRWAELPDIPLYLDQMLMVIHNAIGLFFQEGEPVVTKTMINNYVKLALVDPPNKKRYGREQLARIILISLLKRTFSMGEIDKLIEHCVAGRTMQYVYDLFMERLEAQLAHALPSGTGLLAIDLQKRDPDSMCDIAISAFLCKWCVQYYIEKKAPTAPR